MRIERLLTSLTIGTALLAGASGVARAKPEAPSAFCAAVPDSAHCQGRVPDCGFCHTSTAPVAWNVFGMDVLEALPRKASFAEELGEVLRAVEAGDADGDGASNGDEIRKGTLPGSAASVPAAADDDDDADPSAARNPDFDVGRHDAAFAYKRVSMLYCGHTPSYEEMRPFHDETASPDARRKLLHDKLDACLESTYWRKEGLMRLADDRIRPITNLGVDAQVTITIPLDTLNGKPKLKSSMGDYSYDYRLWVHALTGNRDARDLLLAQYYVKENPDGSWSTTEAVIPNVRNDVTASGQLLQKPYRAGMLSSMWFITRNTMFAELPRTTAAAAYRAYLGADISKMQGLIPVPNEPDDIDNKGVKNAKCAVCHSTLDPLAYAFASYNGFEFNLDNPFVLADLLISGNFKDFALFGIYDPNRPKKRMPKWSASEQQPWLLGQKVSSLREFAQVAAESDEFARNLASIFFMHALTREPDAADFAEFNPLWQKLPEDKFSANKLIHRLIDTQAFGAP
ncbi:MAG: DUF1585 domain-containing protein [Polyangiales bacterium]